MKLKESNIWAKSRYTVIILYTVPTFGPPFIKHTYQHRANFRTSTKYIKLKESNV